MKLALNGFGRIGRAVMRQILSSHPDITVSHINDIADVSVLAYLFRYDSTYGPYPGEVTFDEKTLVIDGRRIPVTQNAEVEALDLSGTDVLLECTGKIKTAEDVARAVSTGARNVLISGPCTPDVPTIIAGANDADLGLHRAVSNGSCTTHAIAPLVAALDKAFGLRTGHVTTVHCYTNSQPLVDGPRGSFARSRAAAESMVPTSTSATQLVTRVLPRLEGRLTGAAIRVPTPSVSCIDAVLTLEHPPQDAQAALRALIDASPVMGWTDEPLVSVDLRARPESLVLAAPETHACGAQLRVFGWYDNEWGFSARMLELAARMTSRPDTAT